MSGCERQGGEISPRIVLYFYDELAPAERAEVARHLRACGDCRGDFEELSIIRSALAARPKVDAPPGGDWTPFMQRLDDAVRVEAGIETLPRVVPVARAPGRASYAPYLAMAALLALVTIGVVYVARSPRPSVSGPAGRMATAPIANGTAERAAIQATTTDDRSGTAAFAALSEQHFERSKLVVLGLANKDARRAGEADWAYERGLASDLLSDTRLYRLAAEDRGMRTLAGVMGDLELVLLQTSLADAPDAAALEQIQRLIHKRHLVTRMDGIAAGL